MDRHKSLYKDNCASFGQKVQHLNRERQLIRNKQRNDQYLSTRNISVSPTPQKACKEETVPLVEPKVEVAAEYQLSEVVVASLPLQVTEENKENSEFAANTAPAAASNQTISNYTSRIAKVACKTDDRKWTRQEMYLHRYIAWKDAMKGQLEERKQQRLLQKKPFVPVGGSEGSSKVADATPTTAPNATFVPKNHKFTAPAGLKNPADIAKSSHINKSKQRQSLYTVVPTPEKKKNGASRTEIKRTALIRKVLLATNVKTPAILMPNGKSTKPAEVANAKARPTEPVAKAKPQQPKTTVSTGEATKTTTNAASKKPTKTATTSTATTHLKKPAASLPTTTAPSVAVKPEPHRFVKPRALVLPPPPAPTATATKGRARIVKPIRGGGGGGGGGGVGVGNTAAVNGRTKATTAANAGGGAVAKAKAAAAAAAATNKCTNTKINANTKIKQMNAIAGTKPKLAISMKVKKPQNSVKNIPGVVANKKKIPAILKLSKQNLLDIANKDKDLPIIETPHDLCNNVNPFGTFVTSTQRKSLSNSESTLEFLTLDTKLGDTISPVEPLEKAKQRKSAAKRQLIQDEEVVVAKGNGAERKSSNESRKKNKFNFVRYSEVATEETPDEDDMIVPIGDEENDKTITLNEHKEDVGDGMENKDKAPTPKPVDDDNIAATPPRTPNNKENAERPINYLSPFVSVARGKVNSRVEKEKRNSIYLQSQKSIADEAPIVPEQQKDQEDQEALVTMRRTLEAVRYFRKQLKDEIERLHGICDKWEAYKTEQLTLLQETGGDDMINVTIGQTKLLTSKKFMQFNGLIDRCEQAVTAPHLLVNDGSEATKPITATDLEGFWCMLGLQVDNVEKRFNNLERWRANNWSDPDEVKTVVAPKQTKQLTKAKKAKTVSNSNGSNGVAAKAKASSDLKQMMRKMHADMRKNKAAAAAAAAAAASAATSEDKENEFVSTPTGGLGKPHSVLTPQRISSPHRRISIIVKDRKSHSAAPTILTINTTPKRKSLRKYSNSPQDSPKLVKHVQGFRRSVAHLQKSCNERNELWMSAIKGADQQRRKSIMATPPPLQTTPPAIAKNRKSILKTPGTTKGKPKNVNFNEELRIKKFKFTIDSDQSDEADDGDDDDGGKEQELRARKSTASERDSEQALDVEARTYTLRNRKVLLRPSGDFEIP